MSRENNKKSFLIVVPWYKPIIGGVVIAVERLCRALIAEGHSAAVLVPGEAETIRQVMDDDGIPVYNMNLRAPFYSSFHPKPLIVYLITLPRTMLSLRKFVLAHNISAIILAYPEPSGFCFLVSRWFLRVPYIVWAHGSDINFIGDEVAAAKRLKLCIIRHADALVTVSAKLLERAAEVVGDLPSKSIAIPTGIDPKWGDRIHENEYKLPDRYVLTLAGAWPVKGPDIVIKAFREVADRFPEARLVMIGTGPEEDNLRGMINDLRLADNIIRLGAVPNRDVPYLMKQSLFGVIPSRNEGFPLVALEYHLMKRAIVATKVGGLPEIISHGVTGLLVASEDASALAEQIEIMLGDPQSCEKMGCNGYNQVHARYTLDKMAAAFTELVEAC